MTCDDNRLIPDFICQALLNKDITIYGSGKQPRSFQYIDDLVEAMLLIMERRIIGPVNIGNPQELSINELTKLIIDITGSSSKLKFLPLPEDDPQIRCSDINLINEKLGCFPKHDLRTGLKKTIIYSESILSSK